MLQSIVLKSYTIHNYCQFYLNNFVFWLNPKIFACGKVLIAFIMYAYPHEDYNLTSLVSLVLYTQEENWLNCLKKLKTSIKYL